MDSAQNQSRVWEKMIFDEKDDVFSFFFLFFFFYLIRPLCMPAYP